MDVRGSKQPVEFRGNMICIARRWTRITPSQACSILGTNLRMQGQFRLHTCPGQPIFSASSLEHDGWRTLPHALQSHEASVHPIQVPGRRVAIVKESNRVESGQCRHSDAKECDGPENDALFPSPRTRVLAPLERDDPAQRPTRYECQGQYYDRANYDVVEVHRSIVAMSWSGHVLAGWFI